MPRALATIVCLIAIAVPAAPALGEVGADSLSNNAVEVIANRGTSSTENLVPGPPKPPRGPRNGGPPRYIPPAQRVRATGGGFYCSLYGPWNFGPVYGIGTIPACPAGPGAPAQPPPSPLDAASQVWATQVVLPDPVLGTSPTKALTGLDTFLIIGGPKTVSWSGTALGYQIRLDVVSTYDIDWGDPRPDESKPNGRARITGTTSQGGPWPNGDLRHQYIERGTVTIQVTQRWTAHWSAGDQSGTLANQLFTTSSLALPIEELQAVVTG